MKRFNPLVDVCYCQYYHRHIYKLAKSFRTISILTNSNQIYPIRKDIRIRYNRAARLQQFSYVLDKCVETRDLFDGKLVHTHLIKFEFTWLISLWNKILALYCKCGYFRYARHVFDKMLYRDTVSFNTVISTCVREKHNVLEVFHLYSMMKNNNIKPNYITLAGLIGACDGLDDGKLREVLHSQAMRYGLSGDEFLGSSLMDGYAKEKRLEAAMKVFDEISELDIVSWNIMIDAYVRNNSKVQAMKLFSRMLFENVAFDSFTLTSVVKTCSEPVELKQGMMIHSFVIKCGFAYETPICNSLINMYSKCEVGTVSQENLFRSIMEPNIISWTAFIASFMKDGQNEKAIAAYKKMLGLGVRENDFSFASILSVYRNLANLEQGKQIHARITKSRFQSDISMNNVLIDMYSKCGSLEDALKVFLRMEIHDVISCTTMITSFAQHSKGEQALNVLKLMSKEELVPDDVSFLACLSACSHAGLVDEGIAVFKMMINIHHIKPRKEHFASVVDMLGRAGRLNEAEDFIYQMGVQFDVLVWEALLGACTLHGEMGLGEKVAKKLLELEPDAHSAYVLLANMYADKGLWENKGVMRDKMGSRLTKETACSWVALQQ